MANLSNINNKFLVTTGGQVGIGNTSPTLSTLTVGIGSTNSPSQICQLAGSGSGVYSVLSLTNTNGTAADNNGVGLDFHVNSAYSATGRIQLIHPTAQSGQASNSSMQFLTYGTVSSVTTFSPRMTIDYRGNVGIGTTSPSADLHVNSENTAGTVIIGRTGTNIAASTSVGTITFPADYNSSAANYAQIRAYSNALSSLRGSLDFNVKSTSGSLLTGLTLYGTSSGVNVGIGTNSPGYPLEVNGRVAISSASAPQLLFFEPGRTYTEAMRLLRYEDKLSLTYGWNANEEALTVVGTGSTAGYVGIGTISPTEKLEVKGNIVLNGQSTATGTTELDSLIFRKLHPSGASSGYYNQGLIKGVTYGGYAGGMNFYYNRSNNDGSGSYTNTQALWLNQYGNFCIGENSSSYKLRVKGGTIANNSVSNGVYVTAGTSSSNHALYVEGESSGGEWLAVRGDGEIRLNASNGHTYAAQGIRFGANAIANNLDDYEEGTWTPALAGVTMSTADGRYVKIGNMVHVYGRIVQLSGTSTSNIITGLPFATSGLSRSPMNFSQINSCSWGSGATMLVSFIFQAQFALYGNANGSALVQTPNNFFSTGSFMEFGGTYIIF